MSCPVHEKYALTVKEAAVCFGIGQKRLYRLINEHKGELDSFVLKVGKKFLVKRERFSQFLDKTNEL